MAVKEAGYWVGNQSMVETSFRDGDDDGSDDDGGDGGVDDCNGDDDGDGDNGGGDAGEEEWYGERVFKCILKLSAWANATSHWLHLNDFSPEWVFKCLAKLLAEI